MRFVFDLLGPLQWLTLLAIPPAIVLLYFLKLKREPLEVPSTYLWTRTVEDLHVNSIWQKLRKNLLLFLQLLLLFLAILACLNPSWRGSSLEDDRVIFLIDNSASMSATDVSPNRLEEAKKQVRTLIDDMKSRDLGMIIAFSDSDGARTIQSYTNNRRQLKQKLDMIKPTHRKTDLKNALRFAAGLANPGRNAFEESDMEAGGSMAMPATLFIVSDGRVNQLPNFTLGNLKANYLPIGKEDSNNVGLVAFQSAKNSERPDETQVYAGVRNYSKVEQEVELTLFVDDTMRDAQALKIPAEAQSGVEFELRDIESGVLRLEMTAKDDLKVDNQAFNVLDVTQRANLLLVTSGNVFLESALNTDRIKKYADVTTKTPEYLEGEEYKKDAADGKYDLVIFDECAPPTKQLMPFSNTAFFGALPPSKDALADNSEDANNEGVTTKPVSVEGADALKDGRTWATPGKTAGPVLIDLDQSHPLMQFVNMLNVLVGEAYPLTPPKSATTLLDSDVGPVMAIATRDSFQDLVIGFALIGRTEDGGEYFNTDWVRNNPSYPVFMQNMLSYLGGVSEQANQAIFQPGQLIQLRLDTPSKKLRMRAPDGSAHDVGRGRSGAFSFTARNNIGVYELTDDEAPDRKHRIAVNLFDETESNIVPEKELKLDEHVAAVTTKGIQRTRREAWKLLVVLVLLVLLAEWYIYNRRVYL